MALNSSEIAALEVDLVNYKSAMADLVQLINFTQVMIDSAVNIDLADSNAVLNPQKTTTKVTMEVVSDAL